MVTDIKYLSVDCVRDLLKMKPAATTTWATLSG